MSPLTARKPNHGRRRAAGWALSLALLPGVPSPAGDAVPDVAAELERTFVRLAETVAPSVVSITGYVRVEPGTREDAAAPGGAWRVGDTETPRYAGFERRATITGFVLDAEGHVVTCRDALLEEDGSFVDAIDVETHDGQHTLSRVVGAEPTINLAVIEFAVLPERQRPQYVPVALGNSDEVRPGQWALALGDPYGAARTYNLGLVSASPRRQCYQGDLTATYMQTSLHLDPQSFGGPLFNIRGDVVGLMVPPGEPGRSYAMPINIVAGIARALIEQHSVASPWLGFSVLEIAAVRARQRGAGPEGARPLRAPLTGIYIDDVYEPSPAARAGIRVGDFLVALDGNRLFSILDFQKWLYLSGIGRTVRLEIFREGETFEIEATVETRPAAATPR